MFKRILKTLACWILIFVVFFLVSEVFFRIFRHEKNPLTDISQSKAKYLLKPNQVLNNKSVKDGEFNYTARINSYGYRGKEFIMPKPDGVVRIFAAGDSFTFGVGAQENETFAALIEEKLKGNNLPIEVINAGVGHASPIRHYVNLRDIHLGYDPDIVILFFDLTDLADDWRTERNAIVDQNGEIIRFDPLFMYGKRDWWITMVNYSVFCRYIHNKMVRTFEKIHILGFKEYMKLAIQGKRAKAAIATSAKINQERDTIEYDGLLMMRGHEKEAQIRKHWLRTEKYLTKIKKILDERHIPFIIVMYPHGIYAGAEEWTQGRQTWGFEPHKLYTDRLPFEIVQDYARRQRIPFINTLDNFLNAPAGKYFFNWDGHMAPSGNRIVARAIDETGILTAIVEGKMKTSIETVQNSTRKAKQ